MMNPPLKVEMHVVEASASNPMIEMLHIFKHR